jgi:hypothetical protein
MRARTDSGQKIEKHFEPEKYGFPRSVVGRLRFCRGLDEFKQELVWQQCCVLVCFAYFDQAVPGDARCERPSTSARRSFTTSNICAELGDFGRAIRFGSGADCGKPASAVPTHQSAAQMGLIQYFQTKQILAMKVRSRLRVICATPVQKRAAKDGLRQFLCCVCRDLR